MENLIVNDCEVYPNYFLAAFKNIDTGKTVTIESKGKPGHLSNEDINRLKRILCTKQTFGFNSRNYDLPIMLYALKGSTCENIHKMSDYIINNNSYGWQTLQKFGLYIPKQIKHFDIQEPSPGVKVSLKLYGGRMHSKKLQDLPIEPGTILTPYQMEQIKLYCINDLDTTIDLYNKIEDRMQLRIDMSEQYGQDLLSKSDAQIAEAVIKSELESKNKTKFYAPEIPLSIKYKYKAPEFISFESDELNKLLDFIKNHDFELDGKGSIQLPDELKKAKIKMGYSEYKIGIGGIHTKEKKQTLEPTEHQMLIDKDVAAYYPNIILNLGLYPKHLGPSFLDVYKNIVDERLKAKKEKNKVVNESLKIVINGSFGKLGNKYSVLYSPDLMIQVTLTGQLSLLMLIERLENNAINVMSANTDGFVSLLPKSKYDLYSKICNEWEEKTNFELEETPYKALYSRDVNNYLAITDNGCKGKGIFTLDALGKNPTAPICIIAVQELLMNGVPIRETIGNCKDLTKFLTVRTVNGGAIWKDEYLGRVVRWIWSTKGKEITYKKPNKTGGHNKVAKSDGARPIMNLSEDWPLDIDYHKYIDESMSILDDIGLTDI